MDFFTVPTVTFRLFYVLLGIQHRRRKILHFNVTAHPTSAWVRQQLRGAFPFNEAPQYLLMDNDSIFSAEIERALAAMNVTSIRTGFQSPWQNGVVERWVGTCRRELLDHVIVLDEAHSGDCSLNSSTTTTTTELISRSGRTPLRARREPPAIGERQGDFVAPYRRASSPIRVERGCVNGADGILARDRSLVPLNASTRGDSTGRPLHSAARC
jgi:transposase InsO family protein